MSIPKHFLIQREEDYHTHYIGVYEDKKQFFLYDNFIGNSNGDSIMTLYVFESEGNFIDYKIWEKSMGRIYGSDFESIAHRQNHQKFIIF